MKPRSAAVKDGVVTLAGSVDTFGSKYAAVRAVEKLNGVKAVVDNLDVKLAAAHTRSDTEIAHTAVNALKWDTMVPDEMIKLTVRDGWITLDGNVPWRFQKSAAERVVRYLMGVKGVTNLLTVQPKHPSAHDVSDKIKNALRRSAELDAERIVVEASDGTVTLKGTVRSFAERRDAENAAWGAPGVSRVEDRIAVSV